MSLIKCPDCSETVSTKARSCPKCGREIIYWTPGRIFLGLLLVVFGFGGIRFLATFTPIPTSTGDYSTTRVASPSSPILTQSAPSEDAQVRDWLTSLALQFHDSPEKMLSLTDRALVRVNKNRKEKEKMPRSVFLSFMSEALETLDKDKATSAQYRRFSGKYDFSEISEGLLARVVDKPK